MSVRVKLIAAFFAISAFAVAVSGVALYAFNDLEKTIGRIVDGQLPSMQNAQSLAIGAQSVLASAPQLAEANNAEEYEQTLGLILTELEALADISTQLADQFPDDETISVIHEDINRLSQAISLVDPLLRQALDIKHKKSTALTEIVATDAKYQKLLGLVVGAQQRAMRESVESLTKAASEETTSDNSGLKKLIEGIKPISTSLVQGLQLRLDGQKLADSLQKITAAPNEDEIFIQTIAIKRELKKIKALIPQLPERMQGALSPFIQTYENYAGGDAGLDQLRMQELSIATQLEEGFATLRTGATDLNNQVETFLQLVSQEVTQSSIEATEQKNILSGWIILAMIGSLISSGLIVWLYVMRSLLRRLGEVQSGMTKLSEGQLRFEIPTSKADEIGAMYQALETFRGNAVKMQELEVERQRDQEKAAKDKKQALHEMAGNLDLAIGSLIERLRSTGRQLKQSADTMQQAAQKTSTQVGQVLRASSETSSNVQAVAAASEELSASIIEIGQQASGAANTAADAVDASQYSNKLVQSLAEDSNRVSEVIQLISEIAGQTNLLALNASIEAARAGDAGKGFAVVANEVKDLADQTGKATVDITDQISGIRNSTGGAVVEIEKIGTVISKIDEISAGISAAVEQQSAATSEITESIHQAAASAGDVYEGVQVVEDVAQTVSESSQKVFASVENLEDQTNSLRIELDQFLAKLRQS